ncbi:MAG TPA: NADH-quinone oxidoreductase subunit N [Candidatus Sulfotelmatobacter sp.]|nr:NADH-quinone oxidoreductase subunit N [Candidatus Sulfotelmatobacter sp.]
MDQTWQEILRQTQGDFFVILPEVMLAIFGLAILLTDFFLTSKQKSWNSMPAMLGVIFSGGAVLMLRHLAPLHSTAFDGSIVIDPFFIFFAFLFLASTALTILMSVRYMEIEQEQHGEYYALMLFATIGMMFLACGNDLVVLFVALETMALSFYILTGFLRRERRSNEGALKYVLIGAFSSGILAYGFSILYGLTGSTNLPYIARSLAQRHAANPGTDFLTFLALGTVAAGVFFKIAAVPFHQWAPDVYEGAPTAISAYVSVASKAASFALLLRLFLTIFWPVRVDWVMLIAVVAVLSLTVGAFGALTQQNVKRLLAYSSITQVGYVLLGLVAAVNPDGTLHPRGLEAMAFYLFVYAFFNTGAFAVVIVLRHKGVIGDDMDDLNGLMERSPGAAVTMLIFLLSLAGIPPTAGFVAKLLVFWALIETNHYVLAVISVAYILPAVYYYFRMVAAMWVKESTDPVLPVLSWAQKFALAAMVIVSLVAGLFPEQFLRLATYSILTPLGR